MQRGYSFQQADKRRGEFQTDRKGLCRWTKNKGAGSESPVMSAGETRTDEQLGGGNPGLDRQRDTKIDFEK